MKLSLKNRFLIPMLTLIILGMGGATAVSYYKSKAALETSIKGQIDQLVASTAKVMASWVKDRKLDVTSWSLQKVFVTSLKDSFVGKAARKSANLQLKKYQKDYQYYENICVADKSGNIVSAAIESVVGKVNVADREYFKKALEGDIYISNVVKSRATANPVFFIATSVKAKGATVGVFFGVLDVSVFSREFVDTIKLGETGYAFMYAEDGTLIAHPKKSDILKTNMKNFDFGRRMMEKGAGQIVYNYKGDEKLVAFEKVKELGWTAVVGIAVEELMAPVRSLAFINLAVAGSVVGLAAILILLLVHSVVNPLKRISRQLDEGAEQVASAAGQISSSSQQLSDGSSEQAASIEETSSSLEEMSAMTKQNADNANQANRLSKESNETTQSCSNVMQDMVTAIGQVSESSQETQKIVKTIDEIAFQTNLLALNAAVEAARAGEAGAGFAVVADEVRNLAMRAADAAKSTSGLIDDIGTNINEAMEMVSKTVDEFSKVNENTGKASELVGEIAAASSEQAQGIEQVNTAVAQMDKVVQQNASNAEESASASEEMHTQTEQIRELVYSLVEMVDGKAGKHKPSAGNKKTAGYKSVLHQKTSTGHEMAASNTKEINSKILLPIDDDFKDF